MQQGIGARAAGVGKQGCARQEAEQEQGQIYTMMVPNDVVISCMQRAAQRRRPRSWLG